MARIPVHTLESTPENSRDALASLKNQLGKVLNIHGAMAHSPVVLQSFMALQHTIADHGTFDPRTREAIALVVGHANHCQYCEAGHTLAAKAAGLTEAQTVAVRAGHIDFDPKLAALLDVAREATTTQGHVQDATWQTALDAGWTDTELTELSIHVSLNLFTNYFNHMVDTDLDLPPAPTV